MRARVIRGNASGIGVGNAWERVMHWFKGEF
jgi:hypothetical protein